jgi:hypothetical protein
MFTCVGQKIEYKFTLSLHKRSWLWTRLPLKGFRGNKTSKDEELRDHTFIVWDFQSLYLQTLVSQRLWPELTKEGIIKYKGFYHGSWSSCPFAKNVQTMSSSSKTWSVYYPVCNEVKQILQKANKTSSKMISKLLNDLLNGYISFAYK